MALGTSVDFEFFLDKDTETLVMRRRFCINKAEGIIFEFPFPRSRYVRLRPGQEKAEDVSIDLPVRQDPTFELIRANAKFAKRLIMEIGYYDLDLPGLILQIVEVNDKLNCDTNVALDVNGRKIAGRFFPGEHITGAYYNTTGFKESVDSGRNELIIPYMGQKLNGEQILSIKIDGLSIPLRETPVVID
jgi:hypothetical protein